ncbi:MAG TPA: phage tail protein [Steroidobacteraceae bacterium]|nr:phage tail protein [Steroidobacteraceae bacterium]
MNFPTAHAVLRDRRDWLGTRSGLAVDDAGVLALARVPAPSDGKALDLPIAYPYAREVSGLALGPRGAVFVADTAHDRVLFVDGECDTQAWLDAPGHLRAPRGLALTTRALHVADSGNSRVQCFAVPRLEANVQWTGWAQPTSIAVDSRGRVLIVDAATASVHRIAANGVADVAFDAKLATQGKLQRPLFVACTAADEVCICDAQANEVFVFDTGGVFEYSLTGPSGWQPGALAVFQDRIFVADAATGAILIFERREAAAVRVGEVSGWHGPVTALAVSESGDLYIKPGLDATYYRFAVDAAYASAGTLDAGPFDAGEERTWERVWVDAEMAADAAIVMKVAATQTSAAPGTTDWVTLPASDVLLAEHTSQPARFVWFKVELATNSPQSSVRVVQVRAATAAEDLREYLPLTYRRHDQDTEGFLGRWLALLRGEFGRIEEFLDDMPRVANVRFAPPSALSWLAQWLGLELPQIADDAERRTLLARAVQLFARRGTKASIAEFVALHTGIKPAIVESFAERSIWILGSSSRLDLDTRLPALDPLGMIVPDENAGSGCCPPLADDHAQCSPCAHSNAVPEMSAIQTPIGRVVVGESGPLASYQIGLPLYSEIAYRFCVLVDSYRACDAGTRQEIARIVDREKPAHTDYRVEYVAPEMRVGLQARVGLDAIVGGEPPPFRLAAHVGIETHLPPSDTARVGAAALDGLLTLT